MNVPNELDLTGFRIVAHTHRLSREGGGRVEYECPVCSCPYAQGNFTVENVTHVLGNPDAKVCCGKVRHTPRLFETPTEARSFLKALEESGGWEKATLIKKSALAGLVAHFDQKAVVKQKRKMLN